MATHTPPAGALDVTVPAADAGAHSTAAPAHDTALDPGLAARTGRLGLRYGRQALIAAVVIGVVLRFLTLSDLWLDEALSVNIARLPVGDLLHWLRHDGSPPLYYLLLHVWITVFGSGDVAVRALSGVISVASLPLAWLAGRRLGGPRCATVTLLIFALSGHAFRYATETRMYALMSFLVLVGVLLLPRALARPGWRTAWPLTLVTAALAYTHYWAFYLLVVVAAGLLLRARRRPAERPAAFWVLGAMAAAGVLFLPWLPTFVFQSAHTGTPWATHAKPRNLHETVFQWGGPVSWGGVLGPVLLGMALVGASALPMDRFRLDVDIRGRTPGRLLGAAVLFPLVLAALVSAVGGGAYEVRYAAVCFPLYLLLAGLGTTRLPNRRVQSWVLAAVVVLGLAGGVQNIVANRTQGGRIGHVLHQLAQPGDVVGYCPDQLAVSAHRYAPAGLVERSFADAAGPTLVDWIDYRQRMTGGDPEAFADELDRLAGPHDVYLVRNDTYRTLNYACQRISAELEALRPVPMTAVRRDTKHYWENAYLLQYGQRRR